MYSKEQLWKSISNEVRIIKHLAGKILVGTEGYRPSDSQRSTLELLQYLSATGSGIMKILLTDDKEASKQYTDFKASVTVTNFAEKMDEQEADMKKTFVQFTDADLAKEIELFGTTRTKAEHLVDLVLKSFTAYRMQLFLYIRASGAQVFTPDVWGGVDTPPKA